MSAFSRAPAHGPSWRAPLAEVEFAQVAAKAIAGRSAPRRSWFLVQVHLGVATIVTYLLILPWIRRRSIGR